MNRSEVTIVSSQRSPQNSRWKSEAKIGIHCNGYGSQMGHIIYGFDGQDKSVMNDLLGGKSRIEQECEIYEQSLSLSFHH